MVYNGTKCGLNDFLWAPWFSLPTVRTALRKVEARTYMCDNDSGEMFLNFPLPERIQKLCGIDLSPYFWQEAGPTKVWECWTCCAMGLLTSPYMAVFFMTWAPHLIIGDRTNLHNVFRYEPVVLNLPGSAVYDPTRPWVYKARSKGDIAADVAIYVEDLRPSGPTEIDCWWAAQRISSVLAHLGMQDAARKRRVASQTPRAWIGAVISSNEGELRISVMQERWEKAQSIVT